MSLRTISNLTKMAARISLNERLWKATEKLSAASLYNPFVVELAQGTLSKKKFDQYLSQDEYFLKIFNTCIQKGVQKCDSTDVKIIELLNQLKSGNLDELKLHDGILSMERNGLKLNPAAKDYTENLLHVANNVPQIGYLAAAFAPCPVLYKYIAMKIIEGSPYHTDPCFDESIKSWIETYSSATFEDSTDPIEELLNLSGCGLAYHRLLHYYTQSMVLEYKFFNAYDVDDSKCTPIAKRFPDKKINLILDFDETITKYDTCDFQGRKTCLYKSAGSTKEMKSRWNDLMGQYVVGYGIAMQKMQGCKTIEECCQISKEFEVAALKKLCESKFFYGMDLGEINDSGCLVPVHDGFIELLQKSVDHSNTDFKVISANWSTSFIQTVMQANSPENASKIEIISNEFVQDGDILNGEITFDIVGPVDKLTKIREMKNDMSMTVYVGDSFHDILALLEADIGIIIGTNSILNAFCAKLNFKVVPLITYMINPEYCQTVQQKVLYRVDNLYEVVAFMFGFEKEEMVYSMCPETPSAKVLVVGGSDSSGCSGIQADIKTCNALGVFSSSSVTSVTSQDTRKFHYAQHIDPLLVESQIISNLSDFCPSSIKIGMVPTPEAVTAICTALKKYDMHNVVCDPVFKSSTGADLCSPEARSAALSKLFPLTAIVTPNINEAEVILNGPAIRDIAGMKEAAREISKLGPEWVLLKGGHLESKGNTVVDVLYCGTTNKFYEFDNPKLDTRNSRGTGCSLASAIASNLSLGMTMVESVKEAQSFLQSVLRASSAHSYGKGVAGPLLHNYKQKKAQELNHLRSQLGLYFVTDQVMIEQQNSTVGPIVEDAILGGATIVQIRCKDTDTDTFCKYVKEALKVCKKHNVPLIVNDRVDVAASCGADGVHVGQTDLNMRAARQLLGHNKIIGVSASTVQEALQAQIDGADYIGAGTVFPTSTKTDVKELIGTEGLQEIVKAVNIPVVAIGGIDSKNAHDIMECGADGIAVVSAILKGESVENNAKVLRKIVESKISSSGNCRIFKEQAS